MENTIIYAKILIAFAILMQTTACQTQKEKACRSIKKPIEIIFKDSSLWDIRFSPFEEDKVWIYSIKNKGEYWAINEFTGQKVVLEKEMFNYFGSFEEKGQNENFHIDQYDSLIWVGGPNRNVSFYDKRNKKVQNLPVLNVSRIISKPDRVYFVFILGFWYWDRKTKNILQVPGIPAETIQTSVMPNDSTIILDSKYTYYFNSRKLKKNGFLDNFKQWSFFKPKNEDLIFYKNDTLWYRNKGKIKQLLLQPNNTAYSQIVGEKYCQICYDFYYLFDPKSEVGIKYDYRLPDINGYGRNIKIDSRYIWITRPDQVMLIDYIRHKQLAFPIHIGEHFIKAKLDECNIYLMYSNKVLMMSKDDFIKKCLPFDAKKYNLDLKQFDYVVDSLGLKNDTNPLESLSKLNFLKWRYSSTIYFEIINKLNEMDYKAFQSIPYKSPNSYMECYRNISMPLVQRKLCIKSLLHDYGRAANFNKVLYLESEYTKYFGKATREDAFEFFSGVDSVKSYFAEIESLAKLNLSEDSLYYFQSMALSPICESYLFGEQTAGNDHSLVNDRLALFLSLYPKSKLIDNATLYLIQTKYMYDLGEFDKEENQEHEVFLKKFPNSELRGNVLLSIFDYWKEHSTNQEKIKSAADRFIKEFGNDKRVENVKQELSKLKIE